MRRFGLLLILFSLLLTACQPEPTGLAKDIVGNWVNAGGYTIEFYKDGKGLIPGVEGRIPLTSFKYTIVDEQHISIDLGTQAFTIEVKIEGDRLTWIDQLGEEIYTRK